VDCPDKVEKELSRSALPYTSAAHLQIAMFSGGKNTPASMLDAVQVAQEFLRRLPRLADVFERDQSKMHVTQTVDYPILPNGELWREPDNGEAVHLSAGDIVRSGDAPSPTESKRAPAMNVLVVLGLSVVKHRSASTHISHILRRTPTVPNAPVKEASKDRK
jgi:hypothetical protein